MMGARDPSAASARTADVMRTDVRSELESGRCQHGDPNDGSGSSDATRIDSTRGDPPASAWDRVRPLSDACPKNPTVRFPPVMSQSTIQEGAAPPDCENLRPVLRAECQAWTWRNVTALLGGRAPRSGAGGFQVALYLIVVPGCRGKPELDQVVGGKAGQCVARRADRHRLRRFGGLGSVQ
jgi:hypothetical protein